VSGKGYIPNIFTSINLILGCLAIIEIFEGKLEYVPYYIWLAGVVDFLDGFSARLTQTTSPMCQYSLQYFQHLGSQNLIMMIDRLMFFMV
jgi:phosphatidylserine synthase